MMASTATEYVSIQSQEGRYWQCGMWVDKPTDATKYPTVDEAESVIAIRTLTNASIVANNTPWRDLRPHTKE